MPRGLAQNAIEERFKHCRPYDARATASGPFAVAGSGGSSAIDFKEALGGALGRVMQPARPQRGPIGSGA